MVNSKNCVSYRRRQQQLICNAIYSLVTWHMGKVHVALQLEFEKGTGKRKRPLHFRKAFKLLTVASLRYRFCSGGKSLVRIGYGNYSVDLNPFQGLKKFMVTLESIAGICVCAFKRSIRIGESSSTYFWSLKPPLEKEQFRVTGFFTSRLQNYP